jgi:peptidoglycan/LPS O-acetylase OafA/YrhL
MNAISSPTKHVGSLDGWRGVAICTLLLGHFFPVPGLNFGTVGVNLFFVLSGFLMGGLLFEKREPLPRFYRRRIARIIPAHLVFVSIVTIICGWVGTVSAREVLSALFFVNNYITPEGGTSQAVMPFGHIWSLSVEEHSYIALSLVAIAVRKGWVRAGAGVGALFVFVIACTLYYQWLNPPGLAYAQWLHTEVAAYGLLATALWVAAGKPWPAQITSTWAAPALLLAGIALHWWSSPLAVQRLLGVGCFAASMAALQVNRGWFARVLSWQPLRQMGLCSFSVYLWQQPFYVWLHGGEGRSPWLALALGMACGLASFYWVERPARAYLNANWRSKG